MNLKLSLITVLTAVLLFSSCKNGIPERGTDITGTWSFTTLKGEYAELWVNKDQLLTLRMPNARPAVFDYIQDADTIKIYMQGEAEAGATPMDRFYIISREGEKVKLMQDEYENELTLIKNEVPEFASTTEFEQKVLSDFKKRASAK